MPTSAVKVRGLRDLQRAFRVADKVLQVELRDALRDAAEPVRRDAESLARSSIRNIGEAWPQMRVGVTTRVVYVAPKQRSRGRKRPNLAGLLAGRAMEPALERNRHDVEQRVGRALDVVGAAWEHV